MASNHPFVFVHGMMGWGEDKKFYKGLPYWGMVTGNYPRRMREKGYEVYTPSVSPLGSAWDRACELYANLTGGIVPVESGRHPTTEPWVDWEDVKDKPIQKGIWHALPTVPGDHGTVIGGSISFIGKKRGQRFLNAYDFWMDYLDKLPE